MRKPLLLLPLLTATLLLGAAHAGGPATVAFEVTLLNTAAPAKTACPLALPAGANGVALLDAAVAQGCITSWTSSHHPEWGTLIVCIEDLCETTGFFWAIYIDGALSPLGADALKVQSGQTIDFVYSDWFTPFL